VLPAGISLTAIVVCLLLFTARLGRDIARNDPAADLDDPDLIWEDAAPPPRAFNVPDAAPARPVAHPTPRRPGRSSQSTRAAARSATAPPLIRDRVSKRGLEQVPKAPPAQGDPRSDHERGPSPPTQGSRRTQASRRDRSGRVAEDLEAPAP